MPGPGWMCVIAVVAAFAVAAVTTPAGVSGAVLLPPFQASVLDTPIMAIAPTNLVYNIIATPGALYRYWRQGQTGGRLTVLLIAGTVPGVVAGCVIRALFLPGMLVRAPKPDARRSRLPKAALVAIAMVVGCVGGIYGVGGGSALAPVLIADGHPPSRAAPAALASTFVTSVVGVVAFTVLAAHHLGRPPDWPTGILLGIGGLAGGYAGARLQHRVPEAVIRRGLGIVVVVVGAVFLAMGRGRGDPGDGLWRKPLKHLPGPIVTAPPQRAYVPRQQAAGGQAHGAMRARPDCPGPPVRRAARSGGCQRQRPTRPSGSPGITPSGDAGTRQG